MAKSLKKEIMTFLRYNLPDKPYLQFLFFICNKRFLNLRNPKTYCDKLNWLKINDFHPEYTKLTDKLAVRDFVENEIGGGTCFRFMESGSHLTKSILRNCPNNLC